MLNRIWIGFFLVSFTVAIVRSVGWGDWYVFSDMMNSSFSMARTGFELSLWLTGVTSLWLGFMKIAEKGGFVFILSKIVGPLFRRLFPEIPANHPAMGAILMNFSATMLGLENAATPLGLKAMESMQELNPNKQVASNAQIMFLVVSTAGFTFLPISIMVYQANLGASNPADIFIPIMLSSFTAVVIGIIVTSLVQRIKLWDKIILFYFLAAIIFILGLVYLFSLVGKEQFIKGSSFASNFILFSLIVLFILSAIRKKVNVYETFIEGAKEGFGIAIKIIPYLIAILVAVGVFRACGAMDGVIDFIHSVFIYMNWNGDFIPALPTALMKPLSGSAARGLMVDVVKQHGANAFVSKVACTIQGAADTTFYILAVYFGAVSIKKTRYALACGIVTDIVGIIAAILLSYLFFH